MKENKSYVPQIVGKKISTRPNLLKLKLLFKGDSFRVIPVDFKINGNNLRETLVKSIYSELGGSHGASEETADVILEIPIEEITDEQKKVILNTSLGINNKGQLVDRNTGEILGTQGHYAKAISIAQSIEGKHNITEELEDYYSFLSPVAHIIFKDLFKL